MSWCEGQGVEYVLGLAKNPRLKALIADELQQAKAEYESSGEAARVFRECRYQTLESWSRERRVVGKAEHLSKGANPRFIVSSLPSEEYDARTLYEDLYCARGDRPRIASRNNNWLCLPTTHRPMRCTPISCVCTFPRSPTC